MIFCLLKNKKDLLSLQEVNRRFRALAGHDTLWSHFYDIRFGQEEDWFPKNSSYPLKHKYYLRRRIQRNWECKGMGFGNQMGCFFETKIANAFVDELYGTPDHEKYGAKFCVFGSGRDHAGDWDLFHTEGVLLTSVSPLNSTLICGSQWDSRYLDSSVHVFAKQDSLLTHTEEQRQSLKDFALSRLDIPQDKLKWALVVLSRTQN
eukprot:TRINITY_DN760_c0_g2_i3.p2 TRINITY_DN760_c0_g2~~TRINITY_DN760_c0_g2_i3.p2  ORF type:complete len:205 (+),score=33.92 TRINITY_DN760_c0_g2_i3:729-1343(+)